MNVTETKNEQPEEDPWEEMFNLRGKDMFERFPEDLIRGIKKELGNPFCLLLKCIFSCNISIVFPPKI